MKVKFTGTKYRLSYKYHLGNLQVSVNKYIKVQFSGTKLMYRLSYKYRLGNLQVSQLGNL